MSARLIRFPSPGLTNALIRHDAGYERRQRSQAIVAEAHERRERAARVVAGIRREVDQRLEVRRIGRAQDRVLWAAIIGFILALFGAWAGGGLR